ncbi:MoaD/ThiS family protein [Micrococcoides hystricis]|uniref:MoaD/ThiS family protein n=1 Tax=Micrococcoides hystricis TaxID=1572761 RepID=A0ABV6P8S2_9MICC
MTETVMPAGVLVRFFAAAQASAGREQELIAWEQLSPTAAVATLGALQRVLQERFPVSASEHTPDLASVLTHCSFLINGRSTKDPAQTITPGVQVDVLPPFAGG